MPLIFAWTALSGFQSTETLSIASVALSGFQLSKLFFCIYLTGVPPQRLAIFIFAEFNHSWGRCWRTLHLPTSSKRVCVCCFISFKRHIKKFYLFLKVFALNINIYLTSKMEENLQTE